MPRTWQRPTPTALLLLLCSISLFSVLTGCGTGKAPSQNESTSTSASSALSIAPAAVAVRVGQTVKFSAQAGSASATGGVWTVSGDPIAGTIAQDGTFTAPQAVPSGTVTVTYALSGSTASAQVSLQNPQPSLTTIVPTVITSTTNNLSIIGTGFTAQSAVVVNGQIVPATYIDSAHLSLALSPASLQGTSATIQVQNPDPGAAVSSSVSLPVALGPLQVSPSTLTAGAVTLTLTLPGIASGSVVQMAGSALTTSAVSNGFITASGYLPPWTADSVSVAVTLPDGSSTLAQTVVPVSATAVSFDVAARFSTQAAWGPNPTLVTQIQQAGLEPFIDQQMQASTGSYDPTTLTPMHAFFLKATSGANPLRLRTAWAFQTFIPGQTPFGINALAVPWEATLERDAFTNFRQILLDAVSDANIGTLLSLPGNVAPTTPGVHPDQNFAREWMQLFSIGTVMLNDDGTVQVDANGTPIPSYDNDTVLAMSRVLTGWNYGSVQNPVYTFQGIDFSQPLIATESQHDEGSKTLFGTVTLPAGQTTKQDLDGAIDALMNHQNTAPFVSRLLIQRFVKSQPSAAYVKRIATVFKDDGQGVKGNLSAVIKAILLDPEARAGDVAALDSDGFLHDPIYSQIFLMSVLQITGEDDQPDYLTNVFGEYLWVTPNVFSYFSPSYMVPGTQINSPEFQLLTTFTSIQRSAGLLSVVTMQQPGFNNGYSGWLYDNFTTLPTMIDALDHLLYHGTMPAYERTAILNYCGGISDPHLQLESAVFLALNSDSYVVAH